MIFGMEWLLGLILIGFLLWQGAVTRRAIRKDKEAAQRKPLPPA